MEPFLAARRPNRMRLRQLLAVLCTSALLGGSQAVASGPVNGAEVYSAAAAAAKATALLDLVALPGATRVPTAPNPALDGPLSQPSADHLVDHHRWWTIPGQRAPVIAWLSAHPPKGLVLALTSSGGSDQVYGLGYRPAGPGSNATLLISLFQDGDQVDVRADGQVTWLPPKTAAERIPSTVKTATLDYTGPMSTFGEPQTTPKPKKAHRVLTGARLRQIVADLNALQVGTPGVYSCPVDFGEQGVISLRYGGRKVTYTADFAGCRFVNVTSNGHGQPFLNGSPKLTTDLYAAIGVSETPIPRVPPQGPPVTTPAPRVTALEHSKVAAQRVGDAAPRIDGPQDAQNSTQAGNAPRPAYTGLGHFVDRASFWTVKGTMAQLVAYLRTKAPRGYVVAEPVRFKGLRVLVLEPRNRSKPINALVLVAMVQHGDTVAYRVDAQTGWLAP